MFSEKGLEIVHSALNECSSSYVVSFEHITCVAKEVEYMKLVKEKLALLGGDVTTPVKETGSGQGVREYTTVSIQASGDVGVDDSGYDAQRFGEVVFKQTRTKGVTVLKTLLVLSTFLEIFF